MKIKKNGAAQLLGLYLKMYLGLPMDFGLKLSSKIAVLQMLGTSYERRKRENSYFCFYMKKQIGSVDDQLTVL